MATESKIHVQVRITNTYLIADLGFYAPYVSAYSGFRSAVENPAADASAACERY
jgi:hypothetical protein